MTTLAPTIPNPLHVADDGSIRIGPTRLLLDVLLALYHQGYAAEDLSATFPHAALADIYGSIAYYLQHRAEIDDYLARRRADAGQLRTQVESWQDPPRVTREVLLARLKVRGLHP